MPVAHFVDRDKSAMFDVVCDMLENSESELYTVSELINVMRSVCR